MINQCLFLSYGNIHNLKIVTLIILYIRDSSAVKPGSVTFKAGTGEIGRFGSLHTMDTLSLLAQKDESIHQVLQDKRRLMKVELSLIKRFRKEYRDTSLAALNNAAVPTVTQEQRGKIVGSSAVLSHLMTFRYIDLIQKLRKLRMADLDTKERLKQVVVKVRPKNPNIQTQWPDLNDLFMQHLAFMSISEIYGFYPPEMYRGRELDTEFGGSLRLSQYLKLGQFALSSLHYHMAIEWHEFAIHQFLQQEESNLLGEKEFDLLLADLLLAIAVQTHNRKLAATTKLKVYATNEVFDNLYKDPTMPFMFKDRVRVRDVRFSMFNTQYGNDTYSEPNFLALCGGNEFQLPEIRNRMNCYLEKKQHPYLILNPVKTEMLSDYPLVLHFYDVLGNDTIQLLLDTRKTQSPYVIPWGNRNVLRDKYRTAVVAEAPIAVDLKIREIAHRLTGLMTTGSEPTWDVEYAPGRFYNRHSDTLHTRVKTLDDYFAIFKNTSFDEMCYTTQTMYLDGDRLATVLFYVDVSTNLLGGHTPFTAIGARSTPVRGSAVFWYNVFQNGTFRPDMIHGACPVLHGQKIIFDQSIRYNVNFQNFKCSLDQNE